MDSAVIVWSKLLVNKLLYRSGHLLDDRDEFHALHILVIDHFPLEVEFALLLADLLLLCYFLNCFHLRNLPVDLDNGLEFLRLQ